MEIDCSTSLNKTRRIYIYIHTSVQQRSVKNVRCFTLVRDNRSEHSIVNRCCSLLYIYIYLERERERERGRCFS